MHIARMKVLFITLLIFMISCGQDHIPSDKEDYLVFGVAYGLCSDDCVQMFKIDKNSLFEDTTTKYLQDYKTYQFNGNRLSNALHEQVVELMNVIPNEFFSLSTHEFGCPDCYDQGTIYVEIDADDTNRRFIIDPSDTKDQSDEIILFKSRIFNAMQLIESQQ